ncbi:hypothetical protein Pyn_25005 [Prunus yedoensis var. nudiflora]|uniref:Uncharacterized protein n=1 Tax=Prunus yedoensis var. nudiflora TaxID=2094558 RepID=A0A314XLZ4_PRUYE|nr:hypothetical protein Pyn_25005 [Prunus yedoensis var. nudiflora]
MAVAELSTSSYTKTHLVHSSQLSFSSTHLRKSQACRFSTAPSDSKCQNILLCCTQSSSSSCCSATNRGPEDQD